MPYTPEEEWRQAIEQSGGKDNDRQCKDLVILSDPSNVLTLIAGPTALIRFLKRDNPDIVDAATAAIAFLSGQGAFYVTPLTFQRADGSDVTLRIKE